MVHGTNSAGTKADGTAHTASLPSACLVVFFRDFQARSVREAMFSLDQNIMAIQHHARNQAAPLYNTCILPIFLYGTETWSVTVTLSRTIDALDNWCLRRILNMHWSEFVTNDEIRSCTGQPFLSDIVRSRRLVCPLLDISTEPTPDRIITELSRPA